MSYVVQEKDDNNPSACALAMFIEALERYEPGIVSKIKMMDMPIFRIRLHTTSNNTNACYYDVLKYTNLYENPYLRFNTDVYRDIVENDEELGEQFTNQPKYQGDRLEIIPFSLPLVYLPYIVIRTTITDTFVEEEIFVDLVYFELCLLRKVVNKGFNTYFNPRKGGLQFYTQSK